MKSNSFLPSSKPSVTLITDGIKLSFKVVHGHSHIAIFTPCFSALCALTFFFINTLTFPILDVPSIEDALLACFCIFTSCPFLKDSGQFPLLRKVFLLHLLFFTYIFFFSEIVYPWSLPLLGNDFLLSIIVIYIYLILKINHKFLEYIIYDRHISVTPQDATTCLTHSRHSLNEWAIRTIISSLKWVRKCFYLS